MDLKIGEIQERCSDVNRGRSFVATAPQNDDQALVDRVWLSF